MQRNNSFNPMGDRYHFDFKQCRPADGWAQLDTRQDASYYGNWVNPLTLETVSYCEGDITHIKCDSEDEFKQHLTETLTWHAERSYNPKIDGMTNAAIIDAFTRMGFAEWLH